MYCVLVTLMVYFYGYSRHREKADKTSTGSRRMTEEQINELFANIISAYAPPFGKSINKRIALKLATSSVEDLFENITENSYALAKTTLSECGTILEESHNTIAGVIPSGAANMNPAFLLLRTEHNNIHIKVCAKEGVIKQHAAEKAIKIFKLALSAAEGKQEGYSSKME